jgi:hypothetical protein
LAFFKDSPHALQAKNTIVAAETKKKEKIYLNQKLCLAKPKASASSAY